MTQDQKDILLKDLCSRLPYGVKVEYENEIFDVEYVCPMYEEVKLDNHETWTINIDEVKPYLFPLSSMTEEQFAELKVFADLTYEGNTLELDEWDDTCDKTLEFWLEEIPSYCVIKVFDWLNENHFDYHGLIPMGLATDATGLNIYQDMGKNKSYYSIDSIRRFHSIFGKTLNKWKLIKRFISFLRNPEELQIKITKLNNIIISQNQTWEYNEDKDDYILETDLRGKENYDKRVKDKFIE